MTLELLRSNNNELEAILKKNDVSNPKTKDIIRKMKVSAFMIFLSF